MWKIKRILGGIHKTIDYYDMIQENDRIAVGVSGGKDSLTLLLSLKRLQSFYKKKFELYAITIDMGTKNMDLSPIYDLCKKIGVDLTVEKTSISEIIFDIKKEKNPCSLCANIRRGALDNAAIRLNCNKIALAHHKDDAIETVLMSTLYEGRFHTFSPVTYLSKKDLHLIRPLIHIEEKDIEGFIKDNNIIVVNNPCPANKNTKRQYIKNLISNLNEDNNNIRGNIFNSIKKSKIDGWK